MPCRTTSPNLRYLSTTADEYFKIGRADPIGRAAVLSLGHVESSQPPRANPVKDLGLADTQVLGNLWHRQRSISWAVYTRFPERRGQHQLGSGAPVPINQLQGFVEVLGDGVHWVARGIRSGQQIRGSSCPSNRCGRRRRSRRSWDTALWALVLRVARRDQPRGWETVAGSGQRSPCLV